MAGDKFNLIESVVHMTRERDKHSLADVVVNTLRELLACEFVALLDVSHASTGYLHLNSHSHCLGVMPGPYAVIDASGAIACDNDMRRCLKQIAPLSVTAQNQERQIYPVVVNQRVVSLLDIYAPAHGHSRQEDERLLVGIVSIYANFLGIIDDSEHDALTHLLNRRTFDAHLSALLAASQAQLVVAGGVAERRHGAIGEHWLGVLDIDHFKRINDNFGHVYGDEVLLIFADLMRAVFRSSDLLFRYGGEEFVVVLLGLPRSDALAVFNRFREQLRQHVFPQIGQVTVSVGVVNIGEQDHPANVFECADKALYFAKEHGRDQVCEYADLVAKGLLQVRRSAGDVDLF
jgi:diguanylate cyclase (GGDEF)-like protein